MPSLPIFAEQINSKADASGFAGKNRTQDAKEAAFLLESDLRKAIEKRLWAQRTVYLLKNEGIIIRPICSGSFVSENDESLSESLWI
jgi:hypothetical protein